MLPNILKQYLPLVLVVLVIVLMPIFGARFLDMNARYVTPSESLASLHSVTSSSPDLYVPPEMAKLKLCPFDVGVSVVDSSHRYERSTPQSIVVYAKLGERVEIMLKVEPNPNLPSCIRDTLKIGSELNVEYGLRLGSPEYTAIPGVKRINTSKIELYSGEGGLYKLLVSIDKDIEKGQYYIVLYAWVKITDGVDIEGVTEHTIYLDID